MNLHLLRLCLSGALFVALSFTVSCSGDPQPGAPSNSPSPTPQGATATKVGYDGFHDIADCTAIVGWAWDSRFPNNPVKIEIYEGSNLLTTITANQPRTDLVANGKGDGNHGFYYPVPATLKDGNPHSIRVKIAETSFDLGGTPKKIICRP